jgi:hypothetical protein
MRNFIAVLALVIHILSMRAQAQVRVPIAVLQRYAGEWIYPMGNSVMVVLRGDTLFREIPGQRVPLVPISETQFKLGPVFTAEFVTDNAGGITQVLTDGVGVEYRLTRKGSPPANITSRAVAAVTVPRSVLERYVGVYEYVPGQMSRTDLRVIVRLKGDTLMRSMGAREEPLVPVSATRFRVGTTALVTEFVIDELGGVTQVMGTGSQQMKARLTSKS